MCFVCSVFHLKKYLHMSQRTTKPTVRLMWPGKTQISLGICAVWSVFPGCMCLLQSQSYPKTDEREPLPYWVDVLVDLSLCWSHTSYCRFCHALAHMSYFSRKTYSLDIYQKCCQGTSNDYPQHMFSWRSKNKRTMMVLYRSTEQTDLHIYYLSFS